MLKYDNSILTMNGPREAELRLSLRLWKAISEHQFSYISFYFRFSWIIDYLKFCDLLHLFMTGVSMNINQDEANFSEHTS